MDEISFRASEKLENFQLSLAAQQSKVLFQEYSEKGLALVNQAWHSPKIERIQDVMKEILIWIVEVMEKGKDAALNVADPRKFVDEILRMLRNEVNRRSLLFGCLGFLVGTFVGYSLANVYSKPSCFYGQMQAVVCTNYAGTDCATLIDDVPVPRIEETDDVLIQVKASCISIIDSDICQGYGKRIRRLLSKYNNSSKSEFPIILGRGCSGVITEIGQSVTRFEIGDEVYMTAPFWAQGTISELYLAKEFRVAHKPKRIGFEGAAGLPYAGSLALNAVKVAGITKDNAHELRILVCGACSPTGCVLVQYCHLLGSDVTATSSVKAAPVATALGADYVIITQNGTKLDLETEKPPLLKKELELRDLFDVIFVTKELELSRNDLQRFCKPSGRIVSTIGHYMPSDHFGFIFGGIFWSYVRGKCLLQNIFGLKRSNFGEPVMNHVHLDVLTDFIDNQQLQSVVDKVFHPHDIEDAFEHIKSSNSIGSSIITFR